MSGRRRTMRWKWTSLTMAALAALVGGAAVLLSRSTMPAAHGVPVIPTASPSVLDSATGTPSTSASAGAAVAGGSRSRFPLSGFDIAAASTLPAGDPAAGPPLRDPTCTSVPVSQCIAVRGKGLRVLLMGDSHSAALLPAFRLLGKRNGWTVALAEHTGCPWPRGLVFARSDRAGCERAKQTWYQRVVPQFDPDVIVLVTRATDHEVGRLYNVVSVDPQLTGRSMSELMVNAARRSLAALAKPGRKLVVVEPEPVSPVHAHRCLTTEHYADQCTFVTEVTPSTAERGYRQIVRHIPGAITISVDRLECPHLPVCEDVIDGVVVRKDYDHLTERFAATLAGGIGQLLHAAHVG